jgi:hypothetical protein
MKKFYLLTAFILLGFTAFAQVSEFDTVVTSFNLMEKVHYIITWIYYFIMAFCAIWAAIKYIEPLKYLKYHSFNKFLRLYINLGKFIKVETEENKYTGDYSIYFESKKVGLWKDVFCINTFLLKRLERKIDIYISDSENSTLFIFFNINNIKIYRLHSILK